jgi:hypothetical protein
MRPLRAAGAPHGKIDTFFFDSDWHIARQLRRAQLVAYRKASLRSLLDRMLD